MKAILLGSECVPHASVLRSKLTTDWELVSIARHQANDPDASRHFSVCDALITIRFDSRFPSMPALKLLQAPAAGINSIDLGAVPSGVTVCNAYGHEVAVAEYCILGMLACAHELLKLHSGFVAGSWSGLLEHPPHSEVAGQSVCIVGLGRIGLETARRAKALGMRVIGCNRTVNRQFADVDEVAPLSGIRSCVARADFVVLACALAEETRNLVDGSVFEAMKPTAFLINVGRSGLVVEADLYEALRRRRIAGAVLDVWYRYPGSDEPHPRPSAFPFQELDNVIMTPHVSGWTTGMVDRRWAQIARNLDNLARGLPLINVVARDG